MERMEASVEGHEPWPPFTKLSQARPNPPPMNKTHGAHLKKRKKNQYGVEIQWKNVATPNGGSCFLGCKARKIESKRIRSLSEPMGDKVELVGFSFSLWNGPGVGIGWMTFKWWLSSELSNTFIHLEKEMMTTLGRQLDLVIRLNEYIAPLPYCFSFQCTGRRTITWTT